MQTIDRIKKIRQEIPATVKLIAVTKQISAATMRLAYQAGIRDFGESRIQEAAMKQPQLQDLSDITWHLIGHLQTNKAAKSLELFQWIHSVDRWSLAEKLDQLAASLPRKPLVCLQVKIRPDPNKYGWTVSELIDDLPKLDRLQNLQIQGLMVIPPVNLTNQETSDLFHQAKALAEQIKQQNWSHLAMLHLSMGMSDDYQLAIEAGATMIRLGHILFS